MSDNNNTDENLTPQEIVRRAMRELAAEVTQVRAERELLLEGLAYLKEVTDGRVFVRRLAEANAGIFLLETNLRLQTPPGIYTKKQLRVAIDTKGQLFTNITDPDRDAEPFRPTAEQEAEVEARIEEHSARNGLNDQSRQHLYNQFMGDIKRKAETEKINATATPAKAAATLTDIAKRAVVDGKISSLPEDPGNTATPAQSAVFEGLHQGFRQLAAEATALEGTAKILTNGLSFLQSLSGDSLDVSTGISSNGTMLVQIRALALDEDEEPFKTHYMQVHPDGKVRLGTDGYGYEAGEYDLLARQDVELLKEIAKAAVYAGKIPASPATPRGDTPAEQKAIVDAIHQAEGEREMARLTATYITDGLAELQETMGDSVTFNVEEPTDRGDVEVTINRWEPSQMVVTANGQGGVKIGKNEYNAFDPASLTAALTAITRNLLINTDRPQPQNPRLQGPQL